MSQLASFAMNSKPVIECLFFSIIGIYMIMMGMVSKNLISESDVPATEQEKANFKPTRMRRLLVILGGVGCLIYSLLCLWR